MDNTRTALTTIVADSVSKNSSWLSSREFPIQLLCVCPRSKEHTQPIPGQSKFPYILQWVTHCFLLASPQKKCWGQRNKGEFFFQYSPHETARGGPHIPDRHTQEATTLSPRRSGLAWKPLIPAPRLRGFPWQEAPGAHGSMEAREVHLERPWLCCGHGLLILWS